MDMSDQETDEVPAYLNINVAAVVRAYAAAIEVLSSHQQIDVLALAAYIVLSHAESSQSDIDLTLEALGILTHSLDDEAKRAYEAGLAAQEKGHVE